MRETNFFPTDTDDERFDSECDETERLEARTEFHLHSKPRLFAAHTDFPRTYILTYIFSMRLCQIIINGGKHIKV